MENCTEITRCLACGSSDLNLQLDLTTQALANNYVDNTHNDEPEFPLAVNHCNHCHHLQLTHAVDPEIIYKNYLYVSGTSQTGRDHFKWFADFVNEYAPNSRSVLDIGCNDGTQLDYFKQLGLKTYGIDPAENLFPLSSANHTIFCDFYDEKLVDHLVDRHLLPDIIVAQNSFAHNPNPHAYLVNLRRIMKDNSLVFIQTSQAEMVQHNEFDTIYHEHINYFNINSMNELCVRSGLQLIDVIKTPIHGTSYIFVIAKTSKRPFHVQNLINVEATQGLMTSQRYVEWAETVKSLMSKLNEELELARHTGYDLVGYGAAAKGNTLLNFGKITLDAIIDDNPRKQGLYTPGMNIPIVGIDYLDNYKSTDKIMFVPLAWNFYTEIRSRILSKRNNDLDRFVRYFPEVRIEK